MASFDSVAFDTVAFDVDSWDIILQGIVVTEGILFLTNAGNYEKIDLEIVTLLPVLTGFYDENQEHKIYVSDNNTYVRMNLDA